MHTHFLNDLAVWTAVNPILDASWAAAFQADIDEAQGATMPDQVIAQMKLATRDVHEKLEDTRIILQKLFAYVKVLYATNREMQEAFGTADYRKGAYTQYKLNRLVRKAAEQAALKTAELATVGWTVADQTELAALAEEYDTEKDEQVVIEANLPVETRVYYDLQNSPWARMQYLNRLAKVAFPDNPEKQALYQLYPSESEGGRIQKTLHVDPMDFEEYNFPEPISQALTVIRLENKG